MHVTVLPGANRDTLLGSLTNIHNRLTNVVGMGALERLTGYLSWVNESVRSLRSMISAQDIDRLILTPWYWQLLNLHERLLRDFDSTNRVVNELLNAEREQRGQDLEAARASLAAQIANWSRPGAFVVADTSFYLNSGALIDETDLAPLVGVREDPVHLIVPMIIVDELDRVKDTGPKAEARTMARRTLKVLDTVFAAGIGVRRLRAGDFSAIDNQTGGIPRGEVTIEILLDPPGHQRLPIADDEIVDRALSIQPLAGRPVTLLTFDTGQALRARAAGLLVRKQDQPDKPAR
ncbi:PIN domain-containing protein [Longispora urticae]